MEAPEENGISLINAPVLSRTSSSSLDSSSSVVRSSAKMPHQVTIGNKINLYLRDVSLSQSSYYMKVVMVLLLIVALSSCGWYIAIVEEEEAAYDNEVHDHFIAIFLAINFLVLWITIMFQFMKNNSYRVRRKEGIKISIKLGRMICVPVAMVVFMVYSSFQLDGPFLNKVLSTVFCLASLVATCLTVIEINSNIKFTKTVLKGLFVEPPSVSIIDGKFEIEEVHNTTSDALLLLARSYTDLKELTTLLKADLRIIIMSLVVSVLSTAAFIRGADSTLENRELRNSIGTTQIALIFCIQIYSCWQISTFNKYIQLVEEFHHVNTKLLVDIFGLVPDNSLIISLVLSGLYNGVKLVDPDFT